MKLIITIIFSLFIVINSYAADHYFTELPLTASGWTDFDTLTDSGYSSARVLFVSSASGNDSTAASNITTNGHYGISDLTFDSDGIFQPPGGVVPFATISAAWAYMRSGYPDILLLERGGSWNEGFYSSSIGEWNKSGASASARIILASYGASGNRPKLNVPDNGSGVTIREYNSVIVSGIHVYHTGWESEGEARGFHFEGSTDVLVEDCKFERLRCYIQGVPAGEQFCHDIALRRCIFNEGNQGSRGANIYMLSVIDFLTEECIFANPDTTEGEISGNRFFYISPGDVDVTTGCSISSCHLTTGVILKGNIFYHSGRTGLSIRSGGVIDYNLIVQNDVFLAGGHGGSGGTVQSAYARGNVILESNPGDGQLGIQFINIDGGEIKDNILSDPTGLGGGAVALHITAEIDANYPEESATLAKNITISDNIIYNRYLSGSGTGIVFSSVLTDVDNVSISSNDLQFPNNSGYLIENLYDSGSFVGLSFADDRYYSTRSTSLWFTPGGDLAGWVSASGETGASGTEVSYSAPTRTVGSYNQSIGGTATTAAFMTDALGQARHDWSTNYMSITVINYIRAGFDKSALSYGYGGNANTTTVMSGSGSMRWNGSGACVME